MFVTLIQNKLSALWTWVTLFFSRGACTRILSPGYNVTPNYKRQLGKRYIFIKHYAPALNISFINYPTAKENDLNFFNNIKCIFIFFTLCCHTGGGRKREKVTEEKYPSASRDGLACCAVVVRVFFFKSLALTRRQAAPNTQQTLPPLPAGWATLPRGSSHTRGGTIRQEVRLLQK